MKGLRVAVEGGTIYESWAKSELVDKGLVLEADTTLTWLVTGTSIAGVTLTRTDGSGATVVLSEGDAISPFQDCLDTSLMGQTLIYELTVSSEFAGSDRQQLSILFANG